VCELMTVAFERPFSFSRLAGRVCDLERWGLAGFGWGVAWHTPDGRVRVERGLGRFQDEGLSRDDLMQTTSRRFLVHLRRPNKLSTVQLADTQPFVGDQGCGAFCHNGFFERAEAHRPELAEALRGDADSEVAWVYLKRRLAGGTSPADGFREVDEQFGGTLNLGYLEGSGQLVVYSHNKNNVLWQFSWAQADTMANVVCSGLHSDDQTLFDVVFPDATKRRPVPVATCVTVGAALDSQGTDDDLEQPATSPPVEVQRA
jgi:predicted glutamine amidotransferase